MKKFLYHISKKLFTLIAFLTMFTGAKADNMEAVYSIDYSNYTGFPFYVMGYVPEWYDGIMTDFGADYRYETLDNEDGATSDVIVTTESGVGYYKIQNDKPRWHQYFIADRIYTKIGESYTVKALVRVSKACSINVNMGWGWDEGQQSIANVYIPASKDFQELEWKHTDIGSSSCFLVAQPGTTTATIEWKSLTVSHEEKEQQPVTWQEWLTNDGKSIVSGEATESKYMGDAETPWPTWALEQTDGVNINWRTDRAPEICAWSLTMGRNNDSGTLDWAVLDGRARPYPADIETEAGNKSNHVFAVHVDQIAQIYDEENSITWSNQFWIQAPRAFKEGEQIRIKFRYKAEHPCTVGTQWHKKNPSDYNDWNAVGDVSFTGKWQEFDKTLTMNVSGTYSLAFNLCSDETNGRTPNVFYFDDLSWQTMTLDEGYFVAGANTKTGLDYDLDNAIEFKPKANDESVFVATIGTRGNASSYVNQVMISTVRGDNASFRTFTIKPSGTIKNNPDLWFDYEAASNAKITLPSSGVWQITIDSHRDQINFVMLEGNTQVLPEINPNPTQIVVHGQERDDLADDGGTGCAWDNQFFIIANRVVAAGETTIIKFKYRSSINAKTTTQCHSEPGGYIHWAAIGDVNFESDWQQFERTFTIPTQCDGSEGKQFKTIAFNMAEIKEACNYYIKDVIWMLEDGTESLIDQTGSNNFYVKEGAGTAPRPYDTYIEPSIYKLSINATGKGTVTYNGVSIKNDTHTFEIDEGLSATITLTPDDGYRVKSLTVNNTNVTSSISNNQYTISSISANTNVEAEFEAIPPTTYTLSIKATGNGSVSYGDNSVKDKTSTFTVNEGISVTITLTPDDGYRVKSLTVNSTDVTSSISNNQYTISSISANTNVEAEFEAIPPTTYTLSIKASGNGSVRYGDTSIKGKTSTFTVIEGTSVDLIIIPDDAYLLKSFIINDTDVTANIVNNKYTISNINEDITVEVQFKAVEAITYSGMEFKVTSTEQKEVVVAKGNYGLWIEVPETVSAYNSTWTVKGFEDGGFESASQLAAVIWNPQVKFKEKVTNPNMLLYLKAADYAPTEVKNVIVNGKAKSITLTDAASGNNFYCPQEFTAELITYEHNYSMKTGYSTCQGWETIVLPFDVTVVTNNIGTELVPHTQWTLGDSKRPFWLCSMNEDGWKNESAIKANTPYIISMPNNENYDATYNITGNIVFSASNVTVHTSDNLVSSKRGHRNFVPNYQNTDRSSDIYALNVNNLWSTNTDSNLAEGSAFIRDSRQVRPFEAYMTIDSGGGTTRSINIFDDNETTGIMNLPLAYKNKDGVIRVYSLSGMLLKQGKDEKILNDLPNGVYVVNGKKIIK